MKKKVLTLCHIRPDVIRLAPTIRRLDAEPNIQHLVCHSGQHYQKELVDYFFSDLKVRAPDFNLKIGGPDKHHYHQTADLCIKLTELCLEINPDLVLMLGDSNGVVVSPVIKKSGFRIARAEAGMRAGSLAEFMPEEINRIAADHTASLLFAYHEDNKRNLLKEGVLNDRITVTGNTTVEPLKEIADLEYRQVPQHICVDVHRNENHSSKRRLENILKIANYYHDTLRIPVKMLGFWRTMQAIEKFGLKLGKIEVVPLMGYKDYLRFQQDSLFLFSDSGSAEDEAPLLKVPVIVPRDFTERPQSSKGGNSHLIDVNQFSIEEVKKSLSWLDHFDPSKNDLSWLGDGKTSETIVHNIKKFLEIK